MAEKRMFTKKITDSDAFTELPPTTQALYFHLCMSADDDGFNNTIRRAMFNAHADTNDLELLIKKRFVLVFDDSVIVIKHWRMHNTLSAYRYKETAFENYKALLKIKPNNAYTLGDGTTIDDSKLIELSNRRSKEQMSSERQTDVKQVTCQCQAGDMSMSNKCQADDNHSIDKNRLDKNSIDKNRLDKNSIDISADEPPRAPDKPKKHKYGSFNHVMLTDDEMSKLVSEYGLAETNEAIKYLDEYIEMKGAKYKSHYLVLKKWVFDAVREKKRTVKPNSFNDISSLQHSSGGFDEIVELIEGS